MMTTLQTAQAKELTEASAPVCLLISTALNTEFNPLQFLLSKQ